MRTRKRIGCFIPPITDKSCWSLEIHYSGVYLQNGATAAGLTMASKSAVKVGGEVVQVDPLLGCMSLNSVCY